VLRHRFAKLHLEFVPGGSLQSAFAVSMWRTALSSFRICKLKNKRRKGEQKDDCGQSCQSRAALASLPQRFTLHGWGGTMRQWNEQP
jgi:hypothetical protein